MAFAAWQITDEGSVFDDLKPQEQQHIARLMEMLFMTDNFWQLSDLLLDGINEVYPYQQGIIIRINRAQKRVTPLAHRGFGSSLPDEILRWPLAPWEPVISKSKTIFDAGAWETLCHELPISHQPGSWAVSATVHNRRSLPTGMLLLTFPAEAVPRKSEISRLLKATELLVQRTVNRVWNATEHRFLQSRYYRFFERHKDICLVVGDDETLLDCNSRFEDMLGCQREEIIGQPLQRFLPQQERGLLERLEGTTGETFMVFMDSQGAEKERRLTLWTAKRPDGTLKEIGCIGREPASAVDQNAIAEGSEKLAEIFDLLPLSLLYTDRHGRITDVNRRAQDMLDAAAPQLQGEYLVDFIVEDQRSGFLRSIDSLMLRGGEILVDTRLTSGNKREIPVSVRCVMGPVDSPAIRYVIEDISERLRAEKEIRKLSEFPRENPNPIFCCDNKGRITYQNQAMRDYLTSLGFGRVDNLEEMFAGDASTLRYITGSAGQDIIVKNREMRIENRVLLGSYSSYKDARDCYVYLQDITDLVQMAENLRGANVELTHLKEELEVQARHAVFASRQKSMYLANMSHELRTPLNSIIGFGEVLGDELFGELNDKQSEYVGDILDSARMLLDLIEEILDLAKIEAGKMELEPERFDTYSMLERCLHMVREKATRHSIDLQLDVADNVGEIVADPKRFKQIVFNLLSNAVKFTPDNGAVGIRALLKDDMLQVSVWDSGLGISLEDQQRIFEVFEQADGSITRKFEGAGLGLSIVKNFVRMHKGDIWVESKLGKGSTFTFAIPPGVEEPAPMDAVFRDTREATDLQMEAEPVDWDHEEATAVGRLFEDMVQPPLDNKTVPPKDDNEAP